MRGPAPALAAVACALAALSAAPAGAAPATPDNASAALGAIQRWLPAPFLPHLDALRQSLAADAPRAPAAPQRDAERRTQLSAEIELGAMHSAAAAVHEGLELAIREAQTSAIPAEQLTSVEQQVHAAERDLSRRTDERAVEIRVRAEEAMREELAQARTPEARPGDEHEPGAAAPADGSAAAAHPAAEPAAKPTAEPAADPEKEPLPPEDTVGLPLPTPAAAPVDEPAAAATADGARGGGSDGAPRAHAHAAPASPAARADGAGAGAEIPAADAANDGAGREEAAIARAVEAARAAGGSEAALARAENALAADRPGLSAAARAVAQRLWAARAEAARREGVPAEPPTREAVSAVRDASLQAVATAVAERAALSPARSRPDLGGASATAAATAARGATLGLGAAELDALAAEVGARTHAAEPAELTQLRGAGVDGRDATPTLLGAACALLLGAALSSAALHLARARYRRRLVHRYVDGVEAGSDSTSVVAELEQLRSPLVMASAHGGYGSWPPPSTALSGSGGYAV